ncbi:hypothetical protein RJT34_31380 [Clitoria ternatea]|uniref:Uncharacterized protein n=1 Tax=Clitoria ternatea TaxID=43366 RepID=A0AAN9I1A8_CLITE
MLKRVAFTLKREELRFEVEHPFQISYVFKSLNIKWREHRQELWEQRDDGTREGFPNMAIFQASPESDQGSAQPTNVPNHSPNDSEHNQE